MILLYFSLSLLLLAALSLIAPLALQNKTITKDFCVFSVGFTMLVTGLYFYTSDQKGLHWWYAQGREHYQLLSQLEELGGINGMIEKVEKKVQAQPQDPQGWLILGKLYLAKPNANEALAAFRKAKELAPNDIEINRYYTAAKSSQ